MNIVVVLEVLLHCLDNRVFQRDVANNFNKGSNESVNVVMGNETPGQQRNKRKHHNYN